MNSIKLAQILKPVQLRNLELKNRIIFPAFQTNYANEDGSVSGQLINFYSGISSGGSSIVFTGAAAVSSESIGFDRVMRIDDDSYIPGLKKLFEKIKEFGAAAGIQLIHYGRQAHTQYTKSPLYAPSAIPCPVTKEYDPDYEVRELSTEHIRRIVDDFAQAALRASEAGADIIEIHAAHGYLLNEFLSPYSNKRSDEYGGTVENRCRIINEIVERVRDAAGSDVALSLRISGHEFVEGGLTPDDYKEILNTIDIEQFDLLNVSVGVYESIQKLVPDSQKGKFPYTDIINRIKQYSTIPVAGVGSIDDLVKANELIAEGFMDFAAIGRSQIADRNLINKSVSGEKDSIIECLRCNKCCFWATDDAHMICARNPSWTEHDEDESLINKTKMLISEIDISIEPHLYIKELLTVLCENLGFKFASLIEVNDEGKGQMTVTYKLPSGYIKRANEASTHITDSPSGEASESGEILTLNNVEENEKLAPWKPLIDETGMKSITYVPIKNIKKTFALIVLYDDKNRYHETEMKDILHTCATLTSISLMSNRYLNDYQKTNTELKREVEEHKITSSALARSKNLLNSFLESSSDGYLILDDKLNIIQTDVKTLKLLNYKKPLSTCRGKNVFKTIKSLNNSETRESLNSILASGDKGTVEFILNPPDSTGIILSAHIFKTDSGIGISLFNVTEQKKLQEEISRMERLDSLGVVTSGIAHDYNNILTALLGNISLAKISASNNTYITDILERSENAIRQAADLTNQLFSFAKGERRLKQICNIKDLVKNAAYFILSGSRIKPEFEINDDTWNVRIDKNQISQVINNIILNAVQSDPADNRIKIIINNIEPEMASGFGLTQEPYVKISVQDSGKGIPPDVIDKIFDPFFTTKIKGSGLGLATSLQIVEQHKGKIKVESSAGKGTCISILLPAIDAKEDKSEKESVSMDKLSGKILILDDDKTVLSTATKMLEFTGLSVTAVTNPDKAIEHYKSSLENGKPFDVVILDLTIPGFKSGEETFHELHALNPEIKAVASSGYSQNDVMANHEKYGFSSVIPKPYNINKIFSVIKPLLPE